MANWEMVKFGDVVTILNGRAYKQDELLKEGKTPVLRVGNFFSNRGWYYSDLELEENKYCNKGDLLYAWSASFGPKIWDGPKVIYHYHIWKLILNEKVEKGYLFYLLQNSTKKIIDQGHGIAMIHATKSGMEQMIIPLPPLETQLQIAKTLDTTAELLAMRKQQLAELDILIKSTFYDMFGDPVTNEMGWLLSPLGEKLKIKHGFAFKGEFFSNKGEYVLLTPGNFYEEGGYRDRGDKQKYYQGKIPDEYLMNKGDLLIAMTEQAPGLLGSPLIVPESNKFLHNQRLGLIIPKKDDLNRLYLFHLFNHHNVRTLIHLMATGTKVRHTSPSKIEEIEVSVPPVLLQNQFATIATKIEEQKALVNKAIDETQYLFDSLMSEYFE